MQTAKLEKSHGYDSVARSGFFRVSAKVSSDEVMWPVYSRWKWGMMIGQMREKTVLVVFFFVFCFLIAVHGSRRNYFQLFKTTSSVAQDSFSALPVFVL